MTGESGAYVTAGDPDRHAGYEWSSGRARGSGLVVPEHARQECPSPEYCAALLFDRLRQGVLTVANASSILDDMTPPRDFIGTTPNYEDLVRPAANVFVDAVDELDLPLDRLAYAASILAAAETWIAEYVEQARAAQMSWEQIGRALGVSRQAAQQRYGS